MSREPELENKYAVVTAAQLLALERLTPFSEAKIFYGRGGAAVIYAGEDKKALINPSSRTQTEIKLSFKASNGSWKDEEPFILDSSKD